MDNNTLTNIDLEYELDNIIFSDYSSIKTRIEEVESYWDYETAWKVIITPWNKDVVFRIHVEEIDGKFQFERVEDDFVDLDQDEIFKHMFFELLDKVKEHLPSKQ